MSRLDKSSCVQCGLPCREDAREYNRQPFCCSGCETIYRIINEEQTDPSLLCDLDLPKTTDEEALQYLDDEEIRSQLLTYQSEKLAIVRFYIPRIHCSSCIWLLENLHQLQDGLLSVKVHFLRREATIRFNPQTTSLKKLVALLTSLGYSPDLSKNTGTVKKHTNRTLLLQLGVAGFCFGNMMLLSFPEYLNGSENISPQFRHFFAYISIVLSLPILFYSARGFFSRAWAVIRHKKVTLDVPLSLGMIMFYQRSLYDILTHTGMGFMDSFAGLVFFLLIGRWLQQRTFDALTFERDYRSFFPISVTRLSDNGSESIPLFRLKSGDRIRVLQNELIPADAVILDGEAKIDYSFVTGEDAPQIPAAGEKIYAGGRQLGSALTLKIVKDVSQSYLTQLWNEQPFRENRSTLTNFADRISATFTLGILTIATLAALYWLPQDISLAMNAFSAVLIISCPCALALSSPFALGQAQQVLGRHGLFLKNPAVVEALASIRHIVFDKTGTLTGTGSARIKYQRLRGETAEKAVSLAVSLAGLSTHPISRSISLLEPQNSYAIADFQEFSGKGISGIVENNKIKLGSASFVNAENTSPDASTYLSINDQVIGYFHVKPAYRTGIEQMVN
ncbi:MAG: HAD-IC family P-type ATPase, partial [Calditrichota bacterium]